MFYRTVYPKAWQITRKNPVVWFFGLFAALLGYYEIETLSGLANNFPDFISTNIKSWVDIFVTFSNANLTWSSLPDVLALFGLFILFSAITILAISSQASLTYTASAKGKQSVKKSLGLQLQNGVDKFWPVFGLNIINSLIVYFFLSMVVMPLIYFLSNANDWVIYIILGLFVFFILVPLVIIISFVTRYGIGFVVIKNQKFTDAFVNSWLLFRINWIITLENAFLLLLITILSIVAIITLMVFAIVPFILISFMIPILAPMLMLIGYFVLAVIFITGTAIHGSFYNIVWATIFLDLIAPGKSHGKIHRVAHKHLPKLTK
jgi:hypothetical protein